MSWFVTNGPTVLLWASAIVGGASALVLAVAPLTKTKVDDKLGGLLNKLHGLLSKVALHPKPDAKEE